MSVLNGYNAAPASYDAHLHIVPSADLATFDPTLTGDVVTAIRTIIQAPSRFNAGIMETTASAGGILLGAGTYWFGVTPIIDDASPLAGFGFAFSGTDAVPTVAYSAGTAVTGTSISPSANNVWEARANSLAIRVEGTAVPEPSSALLLGFGALAFLSRRRK